MEDFISYFLQILPILALLAVVVWFLPRMLRRNAARNLDELRALRVAVERIADVLEKGPAGKNSP